jgi:hypothetical protein
VALLERQREEVEKVAPQERQREREELISCHILHPHLMKKIHLIRRPPQLLLIPKIEAQGIVFHGQKYQKS